jgi:hypothetical protein
MALARRVAFGHIRPLPAVIDPLGNLDDDLLIVDPRHAMRAKENPAMCRARGKTNRFSKLSLRKAWITAQSKVTGLQPNTRFDIKAQPRLRQLNHKVCRPN